MTAILRAVNLLTWLCLPCMAPMHIGIDSRPMILNRLVQGISHHENCIRWNNPGCLSFARQRGASRTTEGYAAFKTMEHGKRALQRDVEAKLSRGLNVRGVVPQFNEGYLV